MEFVYNVMLAAGTWFAAWIVLAIAYVRLIIKRNRALLALNNVAHALNATDASRETKDYCIEAVKLAEAGKKVV